MNGSVKMETREVLEKVKRGEMSIEKAEQFFRREPFDELGYANNIKYCLMDLSGNILSSEYTNIYSVINRNEENIENYKEILTDIEYNFVGDKYYTK